MAVSFDSLTVDLDLLPVPPMTHGAAEHVHTTDQVAALVAAYYYPSSRATPPDAPRLERRQHDRCSVMVFRDTGVICSVRFREPDDPPAPSSPVLPQQRKPHRKGRKGGRGNVWPTTWAELRRRMENHGCTIERGGKHWRVTLPGGSLFVVSCTASDWRSLRNTAMDLRARGIDVSAEPRRPS